MEPFQALVQDKSDNGQSHLEVKDITLSDLSEGDVTIEVAYSGINYKDGMVAIQNQMVKDYPHIPGIDLAGTVIDSKDERFQKGDEVIATSYAIGTGHTGGFSQVARIPKEWVVPLPEGLSMKEAMILGTAGLTAGLSIQRLEDNGAHPDNGPVLVAGATGGVGSLSVDMLNNLGYEVTASTGKTNEKAYLQKLGAKEIVHRDDIKDTDGTPTRKKQWAAAIDPVGGETLQYILSSLKYDGSVATCGLADGINVSTTVMPFIGRGINWLGIDSVQTPMDRRVNVWKRLGDDLKPSMLNEDIVNEVSLEEAPNVLKEILEGKVRGRTLIKM